ncbi:hypothetical protein L226DRAFT_39283 [Lentinus tigrinus ALCF2SS1-7]|uniref:Uncharacterized protein n=1 Tax=Lentinus tigrinus ALCF2SS1-6 TaxID=1328759 RepID=A0A5C2SNF9_9APHY|nr:hypothetical protein L227DRAFT_263431 [Lentinus tigrinus ALCF2SS1-6]RPD82859.1 hypothetical protein L226DRAFT_39283 [Lentinus tigrinus ALCF2SS1-7]
MLVRSTWLCHTSVVSPQLLRSLKTPLAECWPSARRRRGVLPALTCMGHHPSVVRRPGRYVCHGENRRPSWKQKERCSDVILIAVIIPAETRRSLTRRPVRSEPTLSRPISLRRAIGSELCTSEGTFLEAIGRRTLKVQEHNHSCRDGAPQRRALFVLSSIPQLRQFRVIFSCRTRSRSSL